MEQGLKPYIAKLVNGDDLTSDESFAAFRVVMGGAATVSQIGALLTALRMKGETADEIAGAAAAMRDVMVKLNAPANAMDIVGTGGDKVGTYNISTATALVVASAGVPVAKHGNRAASSRSGSSDILAALGLDFDVSLAELEAGLSDLNFTYMMAQNHHRAVRNVMPARMEIGIPTIFNFLGPLCNPASVSYGLFGCFDINYLPLMAKAMTHIHVDRMWFVTGQLSDGRYIDEISLSGPTKVIEVAEGDMREFTLVPEDAGLATKKDAQIIGGTPAENATALNHLLRGAQSDYRNIVALNAAAAFMVAGTVSTLEEGRVLAEKQIDQGLVNNLLNKLRTHYALHTGE